MNTNIFKAVNDLKKGDPIILIDDINRENEGDLIFLAEKITPDAVNFMIKNGRGLLCLAMKNKHIKRLQLPMMTYKNQSIFHTNFTVSIEASSGITTGISTKDRAHTILKAANPKAKSSDIVVPGHIFPLKAHPRGVFGRNGQTEGAVDLASICNSWKAAVICEILNDDGTMSRLNDLKKLSNHYNIPMISNNDIRKYRIQNELLIKKITSINFPNKWGKNFSLHAFISKIDKSEIIVVTKGNIFSKNNIPVRIHSECFTGDILHSYRCDCNNQLHYSLDYITKKDIGILIYLRQEGRGIGLINKMKAYFLQDLGYDTIEANNLLGFKDDHRDYANAYQVLKYFDIDSIQLITNNPDKINQINDYGIKITKRIPLNLNYNSENIFYLQTKKQKMGHFLNI